MLFNFTIFREIYYILTVKVCIYVFHNNSLFNQENILQNYSLKNVQ